ncbi:MAG: hemolysin family protein [Pseudomonadota bacterium]
MGDDAEGSSMAAPSARADEARTKQDQAQVDAQDQKGFFGRIISVLSPTDIETVEQVEPVVHANGSMAPKSALGMLNLRRLRVEDVAIPKIEIEAVPVDINKDELIALFRKSGFSRLPVFDGTLDTPVGMIHLKDLALVHGFNGGGPDFEMRAMLRPLLFAPPSMPIGVLLQKMQSERVHMALVIDEYGGVDGLVTIEDLIEQVVGEIEDEHDVDEADLWVRESPGCYLVQARAPVDEFEAVVGRKLQDPDAEEEIDTMGGLVFVLTGRVPARGEVVSHPDGLEFEVVDADPRRVKRLRVRVPDADWT